MAARGVFRSRTLGLGALVVAALVAGCDRPAYTYRLRAPVAGGSDFEMPSGLRVFVRADPTRPSVTVVSVIDAGSTADPPELPGMARLVADASRRARVDGETIEQALERLGGTTRTVWARTRVTHVTTVPVESLTDALRVEAARLVDPLVGVDELAWDIERRRALSRLRGARELTGHQAVDDAFEALLTPPGLAAPSVERALAALDRAGLEQARAFAAARYRPAGMTVVISGPIDPAQGRGLIVAGLPPALILADPAARPPPAGARVPDAPEAAPPPPASRRRFTAPIEQTRLMLGWRLPGEWHTSIPAWRVIAERLEGYLRESVRARSQWDEVQLVGAIGCAVEPGARTSRLTCALDVAPGVTDLVDLLERAAGGPALMWQSKTEPVWIMRARDGMLGRLFEDVGAEAAAVDVAHAIHDRGVVDPSPDRFRALGALGPTEMRDLIYAHLDRAHMAGLIVEPGPARPSPIAAEAPTADRWSEAPTPWPDAFGVAPWIERTFGEMTAARIAEVARPPVPGPARFTLSHGVPVYVLPTPGLPLARVTLHTWGGTGAAGRLDFGEWSSTEDRAELASRIMGRWDDRRTVDATIRGVQGSPDNLDELTHIFAEAARTRQVEWVDWRWDERARLLAAEQRQRRMADPERAVADALAEAMYGARGLGRRRIDVPALAALDEATLRQFFERVHAPANATVIVTGDVDPAEVERQLERRLGPWRKATPGTRLTALEAPPPPADRRIVFRGRPGTGTRLEVRCLLDAAAGRAAGAVAAAAVEAAVDRVLVDAAAAAAAVTVEHAHLANGNAALTVTAAVGPGQAAPALKTTLGVLETLGAGALPTAHLRQAQWRVAHRDLWAPRTAEATTARFAEWLDAADPVAAVTGWPAAVSAVDPAAVGAALAPCAGHEVIGVIGRPEVTAELAGFGEVSTLEPEAPAAE